MIFPKSLIPSKRGIEPGAALPNKVEVQPGNAEILLCDVKKSNVLLNPSNKAKVSHVKTIKEVEDDTSVCTTSNVNKIPAFKSYDLPDPIFKEDKEERIQSEDEWSVLECQTKRFGKSFQKEIVAQDEHTNEKKKTVDQNIGFPKEIFTEVDGKLSESNCGPAYKKKENDQQAVNQFYVPLVVKKEQKFPVAFTEKEAKPKKEFKQKDKKKIGAQKAKQDLWNHID